MSVARAARRCGMRRFLSRRAGTVALLTLVWLAQLAAPALPVVPTGDDDAPCCRGRCCCSGASPSDVDCIRTACPCGRDTHPPALPAFESGPALLLPALCAPRLQCCGPWWGRVARAPRAGTPRAPDPPPWPALVRLGFA